MKIDVFGVEQKSFKDKKDGSDVVYYRAYGIKTMNTMTGSGGRYAEIKIGQDCYKSLFDSVSDGIISVEFEFDEFGRVTDWVIL